VRHLYTDVLDELPWMLEDQQASLKAHVAKYEEHYAHLKEQTDGL
jgi:hypothetical protein